MSRLDEVKLKQYEAIRKQAKVVSQLRHEHKNAAKKAKDAKQRLNAAESKLSSLCGNHPERQLKAQEEVEREKTLF